MMRNHLSIVSAKWRRTAVMAHDVLMIALAWMLAYYIRFDFSVDETSLNDFVTFLTILLPVQAATGWWFGLYRGLWRFASVPDLWNIIRAVTTGFFISVFILFLYNRLEGIPRSSLGLYPFFLIFLLGTPRLIYRMWKDHSFRINTLDKQRRVLIIGAGNSGETLIREMLRDGAFRPVGLLDDSPSLQGVNLHGVQVLGPVAELERLVALYEIDLIVIAIPSANSIQMRNIVEVCEKVNIPFWTLPPIQQLVEGQITLEELRKVSIDDLLGREPVKLDWENIKSGLSNKCVLITGAGGSIGSELSRQVARQQPAQLIIFEQSEFNLYSIEMELKRTFPEIKLIAILGSVLDRILVEQVFTRHRPDVVFHAAAYKHVPLLENQVRQAAMNNILATRIIAEAAAKHRAEDFVLISTDKAVNPSSYMGASKRVAEIFCQTLNERSSCNFITVRFGNVLGSAGSVVPLFSKQIEQGGPVTVTHPEIERFFMTIPEAGQLILQAAAMGTGGEIFVLDMGKAIKIAYLAEQMIRLSGKEPGVDIMIEYIGLRPGEKLYEELFHNKEKLEGTAHEKILLARHRQTSLEECLKAMSDIELGCRNGDEATIMKAIQQLVPEMQMESNDTNSKIIRFKPKV